MQLHNLRFVRLTDEESGEVAGVAGEFVMPATAAISAVSPDDPAFSELVMRQLLQLLQEHFATIPTPTTP